jgi:hypothetical protein
MRLFRHPLAWLACLALAPAASVRADAPPDPLRLVPDHADLLVKIEQPRRLVESVLNLDLVKEVYNIEAVREFYDSTNARRFFQLVTYFEKQLGVSRFDLIDRVAGGGAVVGVKIGPNPAPALLVVQSKDEELLRKFVKLTLEVVGQELARQEAKERPEKGSYRDVETVRIGKQFHAAVAGSALLVSNSDKALHAALDLHLGGGKSLNDVAAVAEARNLLPPDPLVWGWLNFDVVHKAPQAKELFTLPRNDAIQTVALGGLLDVAGRSPFLCAGICRQENGFLATVRLPRGKAGMAEGITTHIPPVNQFGSLPLLEPKDVLFSTSYYLDLSKFWENRAKLFNEQQVKVFEDFDKNSGRFLLGSRFSKLTGQAGAHQRIVAAHQSKSKYKTVPGTKLPAFALVVEMRDPAFGKSVAALARSAALLAGFQVTLNPVEEKHGEHTLAGYLFPEDAKFRPDVNNIRFNFSPCFTTVGDQLLISSTFELGHELIDVLEKEAKEPVKKTSPASEHTRLYAAGGATLLKAGEDQLQTQAILTQALSPEAAREQVKAAIDLVSRLGLLEIESTYGADNFRYDIRWLFGR